jgi:hypothetical protein
MGRPKKKIQKREKVFNFISKVIDLIKYQWRTVIKTFTDRQEALDFQNQCKEDGTFVGYADLNAFPPMAIQKWIELQGDAKLPTTEVH